MTAFEILGLPDSATVDEVKQAYRRRSLEAHPDHGGDAQEFSRLHIAYRAALEAAALPILCDKCDGVGVVRIQKGWDSLALSCEKCNGAGSVPRG